MVMRQLIIAMMFIFSGLFMNAQEGKAVLPQNIQIGDILKIGAPEARQYKYINFPRANFIIKRGGIANYKGMKGYKVMVTDIKEKKDGSLKVKIKRADGGRFFGSHTVVSAHLNNALETGELQKI